MNPLRPPPTQSELHTLYLTVTAPELSRCADQHVPEELLGEVPVFEGTPTPDVAGSVGLPFRRAVCGEHCPLVHERLHPIEVHGDLFLWLLEWTSHERQGKRGTSALRGRLGFGRKRAPIRYPR